MGYKIQKTSDGDPIACDSCGCEVPTDNFDWGPSHGEQHDYEMRPLCEFCACTEAGNRTRYRRGDDFLLREIWKSSAAVANFLKFGTKAAFVGSRVVETGPISIACISPEARDLLDQIMDAYRKHYNPELHKLTPDDAYQFAYWLCRYSGLVRPV